ncbi:MAG: IclR family transcriptional regulator [Anaerolineae bacterium]|nr:IclR family transcriptional regulator [Anaerolineae bacterium]
MEIQSLARGLHILDMFADSRQGLSITEIAAALHIDKSSASRLVRTLVNYGYVQPEAGSRRYILGRRLHAISWQLLNRIPVREQARPYLYRLVAETGECAHTAVYSQGKALMVDDVEAEASLRVVGGIGRLLPLHCTAVGKSLLAFSDLPLPADLPAHTPRTLTEPAALAAHLEAIRRQGYALDDEEHHSGVRCLAAPVYDLSGLLVGTIGISGPAVRVTPERIDALAARVTQAGHELSRELGFQGGYHTDAAD